MWGIFGTISRSEGGAKAVVLLADLSAKSKFARFP